MDLHMYYICADLDRDFLQSVEKAFFFNGNDAALFLTYSGYMHSIGKSFESYLGVGFRYETKKLIKLPFPKETKIQDFDTRGEICVALTTHGCVFQWGGKKDVPQPVVCMQDECAVQISCGATFLMALTSEGKICAWREHKLTTYKLLPKEEDMLEADISPVITKIDGIHRPIVLTEGGKIYLPRMEYEESLQPFIYLSKPVENLISEEVIIKMECGKFRLFALSISGNLYSWNEYNVSGCVIPELISFDVGRVTDFIAPINFDEVVVKGEGGQLFRIIRKYGKLTPWDSEPLNFKNFKEYEATFNCSIYGSKIQLATPVESSRTSNASRIKWLNKWSSAFNNIDGSDVTFVVEGRMIYAHQKILTVQCKKIEGMLNVNYKDAFDRFLVPVENYSHCTIYRFIKFLYCGYLDIGNHHGNIELLKLVCDLEYKPLIELCQEIVLRGIREDNACAIYNIASSLPLLEKNTITLELF